MPAVTLEVPDEESWSDVATTADMAKIAAASAVWTEALAAARKAGFGRQIEEEGPLLDPGAALPRPQPTPGFYHCRILRFGKPGTGQRAFAAFKSFFCYVGVNDDRLALTKNEGSERPGGYLWDDKDAPLRMIFLGAAAIGAEKAPPAYGDDADRNVAAIFERVDDFRFRLVMPDPRTGSRLDVLELTAAP
ncbi:MAG TPA: DUF4893 domain-containing protein [Allosphingosinicella sp.]